MFFIKNLKKKILNYFIKIFIFDNICILIIFLMSSSYLLLNSDLILLILLILLFTLLNFYIIVSSYSNLDNILINIQNLFLNLIRKTLDTLWIIRHYYRRYYTLNLLWNSLLLFGKNLNFNLLNFYSNTIFIKNNFLNYIYKYNFFFKLINNYKKLF